MDVLDVVCDDDDDDDDNDDDDDDDNDKAEEDDISSLDRLVEEVKVKSERAEVLTPTT